MVDVGVDAGALARGGDVHGRVRIRPGGAGANAAVWAASTGAEVVLYGCVGDDLPGQLVARALAHRGVDAKLRTSAGGRTGAMLVVREEGERSMVADRGANTFLTPEDLPGSLEAGAVLVSGYLLFDPASEPAALAALERARSNWVAVDAASWPLVDAYSPERFLAATKLATIILANDLEAEALTGMRGEAAARALASSYPAACVKLGSAGAIWAEGEVLVRAVAARADEEDPTGAGDAFDGVLLARLAAGVRPEDALRDACIAGAQAATSPQPWPGSAEW
jgi:ribokinase